MGNLAEGGPIRFELVEGEYASGTIRHVGFTNSQVVYVAGRLDEPEEGRFFFQKQARLGVAGAFVGVVELPRSNRAYRLEPTGEAGSPELVERSLNEVVCLHLPRPNRPAPAEIENIPPLKPGDFPNLPIPGYQNGIAVLQSLPGATPVLYLDFQGGSTLTWGGITYQRPAVSNVEIRDVWARVAEDYLPFNVNVTTDLGVYQVAPEGSRQRVIITPTDTAAPGEGGAAYRGSFNWTGDTPCWVFTISGKYCAEACSHEAGHTLGLDHDGQYVNGQTVEYYAGHGSGETGWAPIMGLGYYQNVVQWSKGEYLNADNHEDELAIITKNNDVTYRLDDSGDTLATSRYLELYTDCTARAEGLIERTSDIDAFQFTTTGGTVWLRADPVSASPNLALAVTLFDANNTLLASNSPPDTLWASLNADVPAGNYTFRVTGAGRGYPLGTGFSSYGSLGYYSITGLVSNARLPNRFAIFDNATNGTIVGIVPANNPNHDPLGFAIAAGNAGNTFAIDAAGTLSIADNGLLDYATLGANSQLPVQFELFVNITNLADAAASEINRRVVVAIIHVSGPPLITRQPQSLSVLAGTNVSFVVSAARPEPYDPVPFIYQWFFNGAALPAATEPALLLPNVQAAQSGEYRVAVSTSGGSVTSAVVTLSVGAGIPFITRRPLPVSVFPGFDAEFSAEAIGTEPLRCQWQHDGLHISGETNTTVRLLDVQAENGGVYRALFSNPQGTNATMDALLAVVPVAVWGWATSGQASLLPELTNAVQVCAGPRYNLALRRNGSVIAWGATNAVSELPLLTNAIAVAAGGAHGLALKSDGTVLAWGENTSGQTNVPTDLTHVVAISSGGRHSLALRSDGTVEGWGDIADGQSSPPLGLTNVIAVAAGGRHSLALTADGRVWAWGNNTSSQILVPANLTDAIAIAAGDSHNLALKMDGSVVAWGTNDHGQATVPPGLSNVIAIAAGAYHSLALKTDGTLIAWGAGLTNTSVYPNFGQSIVPMPVTNLTAMSGGEGHTLALAGTGAPFITGTPVGAIIYPGRRVILRVAAVGSLPLSFQWQVNGTNIDGATNRTLVLEHATDAGIYRVLVSNSLGSVISADAQLTLGTTIPVIAVQPSSQSVCLGGKAHLEVVAYATGALAWQWRFNGLDVPGATNSSLDFDRALLKDRGEYSVVVSNAYGAITSAKANLDVLQVVAWGPGPYMNYGQSAVPAGLCGVVRVTGGGIHTLALKDNGTVLAWGANTSEMFRNYGQGTVPSDLNGVIDIAAGAYHSLALRSNGTVVAWGAGTSNFVRTPHCRQSIVPPGLNQVVAIAAGDYHSIALKKDGRIVVWGGDIGALTNIPASATNVISVSSRGDNIVALRGDSTLVRWGSSTALPPAPWPDLTGIAAGNNFFLGLRSDHTIVPYGSVSPPPGGLRDFVEIAAGFSQCLARRRDGSIVTWGSTNVYNLGMVPAGVNTAIGVAVGQFHSLAVLGDGSPVITVPPCDRELFLGDQTLLTVTAGGAEPLNYQWQFNGTNLPRATNAWLKLSNAQVSDAGAYRVVVANGSGSVTSAPAILEVWLPVGEALNAPTLSWTASGNASWHGEAEVSHDGISAARSATLGDNQQSSIRTSLSGPGTLTFWWRVSSEPWFDCLTFSIDGVQYASISGEVNWQFQTQTVPPGVHNMQWTYAKDDSVSSGQDAAWLDQVAFVPDPPLITGQPQGGTVPMGSNFVLSVYAAGAPPLTFQWTKDGTPVGSNSSTFTVSNSTRRDSGAYAVVASNAAGATTSSNAFVRVLVPQMLRGSAWFDAGTLMLLSGDADGGSLLHNDLESFELQASTNLLEWTIVPDQPELTNGLLLLRDSQAADFRNRFYRIIER